MPFRLPFRLPFAASLVALLTASTVYAAPLPPAERSALIDDIIGQLHRQYVLPDLIRKLEPVLRKADYSKTQDMAAFADSVTATMRDVTKDLHLRLRYSEEAIPVAKPGKLSPEQLARAQADQQSRNYGIERVERLPQNIGYLKTQYFAQPALAGPAIAAAMTLVANTDALILDLRENGGGSAEMVTLMASYLFDRRTRLNDMYFREGDRTEQAWTMPTVPGTRFGSDKPVYILTSSQTFSAAEDLTFVLKNHKRATVVGENTRGGAHPVRGDRIHAHFILAVPHAATRDPVTKKDWEGIGIAPDIAVPAADALNKAQTLILQQLRATKQDPEEVQEIDARLKQLAGA